MLTIAQLKEGLNTPKWHVTPFMERVLKDGDTCAPLLARLVADHLDHPQYETGGARHDLLHALLLLRELAFTPVWPQLLRLYGLLADVREALLGEVLQEVGPSLLARCYDPALEERTLAFVREEALDPMARRQLMGLWGTLYVAGRIPRERAATILSGLREWAHDHHKEQVEQLDVMLKALSQPAIDVMEGRVARTATPAQAPLSGTAMHAGVTPPIGDALLQLDIHGVYDYLGSVYLSPEEEQQLLGAQQLEELTGFLGDAVVGSASDPHGLRRPRALYFDTEVRSKRHCPACKERLHPRNSLYVLEVQTLLSGPARVLVGPKGGHDCDSCPTILMELKRCRRYAESWAGGAVKSVVVLGAYMGEHAPASESDPLPYHPFTRPERHATPTQRPGPGRQRSRKGRR